MPVSRLPCAIVYVSANDIHLFFTMIIQGGCGCKTLKLSFTVLDIAEPPFIFDKDNYIFRFLKYIVYFCIVMASLCIPAHY